MMTVQTPGMRAILQAETTGAITTVMITTPVRIKMNPVGMV
ncbi:MAG: hypothetical protein R6U61_05225 [Thermoplasmata archaeon]